MANDYDVKARNLMVDALGAVAVRIALHTGDPGGADSATNEVTGGTYARGTAAWDAAGSPDTGAAYLSGDVVIDVPAGNTITYISVWNSAGTSRYLKKSVTSEAFGADGTYTVLASGTTLDLNDA
jgi:hypothetical protein